MVYLHFPDGSWGWAALYRFGGHLSLLFCEVTFAHFSFFVSNWFCPALFQVCTCEQLNVLCVLCPSLGCLSVVSSDEQTFLALTRLNLSIFFFKDLGFCTLFTKLFPTPKSWRCCPILFCKSFIVLIFTFKSMTYLSIFCERWEVKGPVFSPYTPSHSNTVYWKCYHFQLLWSVTLIMNQVLMYLWVCFQILSYNALPFHLSLSQLHNSLIAEVAKLIIAGTGGRSRHRGARNVHTFMLFYKKKNWWI